MLYFKNIVKLNLLLNIPPKYSDIYIYYEKEFIKILDSQLLKWKYKYCNLTSYKIQRICNIHKKQIKNIFEEPEQENTNEELDETDEELDDNMVNNYPGLVSSINTISNSSYRFNTSNTISNTSSHPFDDVLNTVIRRNINLLDEDENNDDDNENNNNNSNSTTNILDWVGLTFNDETLEENENENEDENEDENNDEDTESIESTNTEPADNFHCDYNCGFNGTYTEVGIHQRSCNIYTNDYSNISFDFEYNNKYWDNIDIINKISNFLRSNRIHFNDYIKHFKKTLDQKEVYEGDYQWMFNGDFNEYASDIDNEVEDNVVENNVVENNVVENNEVVNNTEIETDLNLLNSDMDW